MRIRQAIKVYDRTVALSDKVNVFHAFVIEPTSQQTHCFWRRMMLTGPLAAKESDIWRAKLKDTSMLDEHLLIEHGEDPRVFVHQDHVYMLARTESRGAPIYKLWSNHKKAELIPLVEDGRFDAVPFGKNWMPFSQGNAILAVHSFAPFRILTIDEFAGASTTILQPEECSLADVAAHDGYSMFRGGGNVLNWGGRLLGTGHMTVREDYHLPFIWRKGYADAPQVEFIDVRAMRAEGFGVIDPTSLHKDADGKTWMGLSCSERDWFSGQRFASYLCELNL